MHYKQGTSTTNEYLAHFEKLLYTCDIYEALRITMYMFLIGSNLEIMYHDIPAPPNLDEAYQQTNLLYISFRLYQTCHSCLPPQSRQFISKFGCIIHHKENEFFIVDPIENFNSDDKSINIIDCYTVEDVPILLPPKPNIPLPTCLCDFHIDQVFVLSQLSDTPRVASFLSKAIVSLHFLLLIFDFWLLIIIILF